MLSNYWHLINLIFCINNLNEDKISTCWWHGASTLPKKTMSPISILIARWFTQSLWTFWSPLKFHISQGWGGSSRSSLWRRDEHETPPPPNLLLSGYYLQLASSHFFSEILGHAFPTWLPDTNSVIFSHDSPFSNYKRPFTLHHKEVIAFSF